MGLYGACIPRAWKFGPGNPGHMPGHIAGIPGNPGHIEPAVREKRSIGVWRERENPGGNIPGENPGNIPGIPRSQNPCLGNPRLGSKIVIPW